MTKKDLERRNRYLLLQLKMIHDLIKDAAYMSKNDLFENIGTIQHLSSAKSIKSNLEFIEKYDEQYNFYDKGEDINDYE